MTSIGVFEIWLHVIILHNPGAVLAEGWDGKWVGVNGSS